MVCGVVSVGARQSLPEDAVTVSTRELDLYVGTSIVRSLLSFHNNSYKVFLPREQSREEGEETEQNISPPPHAAKQDE